MGLSLPRQVKEEKIYREAASSFRKTVQKNFDNFPGGSELDIFRIAPACPAARRWRINLP